MRRHRDGSSVKPDELRRLPQRPVEPRARHFQRVTPDRQIVQVELTAERLAEPGAVFDPRPAAVSLDQDAQHRTPSVAGQLDVDDLEPHVGSDRRRQRLDLACNFLPPAHLQPLRRPEETKEWVSYPLLADAPT